MTAGEWVGARELRGGRHGPGAARGVRARARAADLLRRPADRDRARCSAAAMSRAPVRGLAAFRTILFLPQVIALVVVAVMWRMIYAPDGGLINGTLRAVGLGALAQDWLGGFTSRCPRSGLIGTWVMYGLAMVLLHRGRAEDPAVALRRRARRRRGPGARVLRGHAAGAARRDRGGADAHDDRRAAQLRPRLHHDARRARAARPRCRRTWSTTRRSRAARSAGAAAVGVVPGGRRSSCSRSLSTASRSGARDDGPPRADLTYLLLGVFSLIALCRSSGSSSPRCRSRAALSAFGQPDGLHFGNFADAWREGNFAHYLRSSAIVVVAVVAISTRASRSWPATRSG